MKFNYGDSVYYKEKDVNGEIISRIYASIVWITKIETIKDSKNFNAPIGSTLYNIEFDNGSLKEFVSEDLLDHIK